MIMPQPGKTHTPHRAPVLLGPNQPDLAAIIADLQRRVARLESKLNTH